MTNTALYLLTRDELHRLLELAILNYLDRMDLRDEIDHDAQFDAADDVFGYIKPVELNQTS